MGHLKARDEELEANPVDNTHLLVEKQLRNAI